MNAALSHDMAAQPWARYLTCLEAYGAQRAAWPAADRGLYDQFAATVAGQDALQEARALDAFLNNDALPAASGDFQARLQSMALPPQVKTRNYVVVMWQRGALMLVLMAALGFGNGYTDKADTNRIWQTATMTTEFGMLTQ